MRRPGILAAPPTGPQRRATPDPSKGVDDPVLFSLELLRPTAVAQPISLDLDFEDLFEALGLGRREVAGQAGDAVDLPVAAAPRSDDYNGADFRKKLDDHVHPDFFPSKRYATPAIPVV